MKRKKHSYFRARKIFKIPAAQYQPTKGYLPILPRRHFLIALALHLASRHARLARTATARHGRKGKEVCTSNCIFIKRVVLIIWLYKCDHGTLRYAAFDRQSIVRTMGICNYTRMYAYYKYLFVCVMYPSLQLHEHIDTAQTHVGSLPSIWMALPRPTQVHRLIE